MDFIDVRSKARDAQDRIQEKRAERSTNYFPYLIRVVSATREKKTRRGNKHRGPKENKAPRVNNREEKKKDSGCFNYGKQGYQARDYCQLKKDNPTSFTRRGEGSNIIAIVT